MFPREDTSVRKLYHSLRSLLVGYFFFIFFNHHCMITFWPFLHNTEIHLTLGNRRRDKLFTLLNAETSSTLSKYRRVSFCTLPNAETFLTCGKYTTRFARTFSLVAFSFFSYLFLDAPLEYHRGISFLDCCTVCVDLARSARAERTTFSDGGSA